MSDVPREEAEPAEVMSEEDRARAQAEITAERAARRLRVRSPGTKVQESGMGRTYGPNVSRAQLRAQILEKRLQGYTLEEIGAEHGLSAMGVHKIIDKELSRVNETRTDYASRIQKIQAARLDLMLRKLWPRIEQGDIMAVAQAVKIEERRAKLLGLDEPAKTKIQLDLSDTPLTELQVIAARIGMSLEAPGFPQLPGSSVDSDSDDEEPQDVEYEIKGDGCAAEGESEAGAESGDAIEGGAEDS